MEWLLVAFGGGIGATLRYAVMRLCAKFEYPTFYATAIVNLIGSFLLGVVLQCIIPEMLISFLAIGVLGAFSTFSTFAFDLVSLFNEKKIRKLINYLVVNLVGGLLLFAIGYSI